MPVIAEPLQMSITEPAAPMIGHLIQHADRPITMKQLDTGQVVIGGGWPARPPDRRGHATVEMRSIIGNIILARRIVPAIGRLRLVRCWAGLNTPGDGKGILGPIGSVPGLFVAVPGDAGYTLGPISARMVADAMLGRTSSEDLRPFAPSRFAEPGIS
jgi:glycine/D-amino acid oxidase-like deaminating enzyme